MLYIGSHVSFKKDTGLVGSVTEALSYGENTFMFYTGAPQNTRRSDIDDSVTHKAWSIMKDNNIDISKVIVHAPYIINLCNPKNFDFSFSFLKDEIRRCTSLGISYLVLHPGSHVGLGVSAGLDNIVRGLNSVLEGENVTILLETMAGKGSELGTSLSQLQYIIEHVTDKKHIGICLDTCHLNDSGYDLSKFDDYLDEFDKLIGISKIKCVHVNDSKNIIGSHKDRHENIGIGTIGFDVLLNVIYNKRLEDIPKILETPYVDKKYPPYKLEISMIRQKKFNNNLIDDIKNTYQ